MMLVEETRVPDEALPLAEFKEHLRLGSGFAEGDLQGGLLAGYLRAAMAAIEARTGKILIERGFIWTLSAWRDGESQAVPIAPANAIVELSLISREGAVTVVSPDAYRLIPDLQRPMLAGAAFSLPAFPASGTARIHLLAGYGPEWSDIPADLAQAVMMLAAHYYEFRHDTSGPVGFPPSVAALIERHRTIRLSLGQGRA